MFSWIHNPDLLGPVEKTMRGFVFWTLAFSVILSGVIYSLSVTARDVQAQEVLPFVEGPPDDARENVDGPLDDGRQPVEGPLDDGRQPVEGPLDDGRQPVDGPLDDGRQPVEGPLDDGRQPVEGPLDDGRQPVDGPLDDGRQPVEEQPAEQPAGSPTTVGEFLVLLPQISPGIEPADVENVLQSLPDSFETQPINLGGFIEGVEGSPTVEDVLRGSLPEADPQELESVLGSLPPEFKADPVDVEGLQNVAEGLPSEEVPSEEVPSEEVPPEEVPPEEVPPEEVPPEEVPPEEVPPEEVPPEEVPPEEVPPEEVPPEEVPPEEVPLEEVPPECKEAAAGLEKAEGTPSSQAIEDFKNKCLLEREITIDFGDGNKDDSDGLKKSEKITIGLMSGMFTTAIAGGFIAYLTYQLVKKGLAPATVDRFVQQVGERLRQGETPEQAIARAATNVASENLGDLNIPNNPADIPEQNNQQQEDQQQPEDQQPEDQQPEDQQPEDQQPEDQQPEDQQPEQNDPEDQESADEVFEDALDEQLDDPNSESEKPAPEESVEPEQVDEQPQEEITERIQEIEGLREILEMGPNQDDVALTPDWISDRTSAEEMREIVEEQIEEVEELREQVEEGQLAVESLETEDPSLEEQLAVESLETGDPSLEGQLEQLEALEESLITAIEWKKETEKLKKMKELLDAKEQGEKREEEKEKREKEFADLFDELDSSSSGSELARKLQSGLSDLHPGYNVMLIQQETYDEDKAKETLEGVVFKSTAGILPGPFSPAVNTWDVWVFESGTFTNEGDLGYDNWVFSGNFERSGEDGETVTFEPIE